MLKADHSHSKLKSDIVAKLTREIEAKLKPEIEAKLKSEIEVKLKPEIEAKLTSEIEANLKPEIEAKLKKEMEHKLKSDIAPKLKANLEAKLKSNIEAKMKPDIEAKLKLDLGAKLKSSITSTTEELQGKVDDIENDCYINSIRVQNQLSEKDANICLMMKKIDRLEQCTKANNIRIVGMKEDEGEDIVTKVINLAWGQMRMINIESSDIREAGRMGKQTPMKTRDVLVKFNNTTKRDQIYSKRKFLMNKDDPIYVNEDLTLYRSQLFFEARKIRKLGGLFGAWTQDGNVMIKVNQNDIPQAVSDYNALKTLDQYDEVSDNDDELSC